MIEFRGSHFECEVILWGVRRYVSYPIGYRRPEEIVEERGVEVDHATLSNTSRCWRPTFVVSLVAWQICLACAICIEALGNRPPCAFGPVSLPPIQTPR